MVNLRAPDNTLRTLGDLNANNLRRFADYTGRVGTPRVLMPTPDISFTSGSTAAGVCPVPDGFECPDKLADQNGEPEDNVLLELAEEKVLGCPPPHNACFRRLHMNERIRLVRPRDPNFDYMERSVRFLNFLRDEEAASEKSNHTHMLIKLMYQKAAKEGIPAFGLACWTLQHASRCDIFLHDRWHDRLTDEEREAWPKTSWRR